MGFNNKGMQVVKQNLQKRKYTDFVIGINIGKNKITPNENAHDDYCKCLSFLYNEGDYFVMNISSPNTPGLRDLQQKEALKNLIEPVQNLNKKLGNKPLLIKIAPDLTDQNLNDLLEVIHEYQIDGLVATNTTICKDNLMSYHQEMGEGGISGRPVQTIANQLIKKIRNQSSIPVIGVGGIMNPKDAIHKLQLGANLIQIYTGYIYYGPCLPKDICKEFLNQKLK
jgi:dihydroorotate dehydrogenase